MPYLLSIDTSTSICSVALSRGTEQVAFRETAEGRSHAKILLPFIEEVLQEGGIAPVQDVRSSLIPTAEQLVMAAELSPVRTAQRLTVQALMQQDTLPRTS